jgi:hypothetical protein
MIVQGWSAFAPFDPLDALSLYAEIPLIIIMASTWYFLVERPRLVAARAFIAPPAPSTRSRLSPFRGRETDPLLPFIPVTPDALPPLKEGAGLPSLWDVVDVATVDLYADEYASGDLERLGAQDDGEDDEVLEAEEEEVRAKRENGKLGLVWRAYYLIA